MLSLLPFAFIAGGLGLWISVASASRVTATIVWTITTLLWSLFGMVGVGFLSLAYRHFFERPA